MLWIVSAILLAQLSWWLMQPSEPNFNVTLPDYTPASVKGDSSSIDMPAIQSLNLFGKVTTQASNNRRDAPKTALNIRLVGVSASSNPLRSAAIIEQSGKQQTYIVGDELGRSGVTVEEIYADRVLLDNNGRIETLQLEDIGEDRPALSLIVDEPTAATTETTEIPAREIGEAMEQLSADPQSITDFVSISPAMENGELIGYRLQAGQKPELFRQSGFQNGDLAVAINGYDLTDMQQAMEFSNQLTTLTRADISILRDGQPMQMSIELTSE
ncbi:MAG: type II secretion system protein GspC [Idiomarina sp.]|uniref:type II secretion system protein GspC n=1 Tax=Idiomarina sp. TaxID=1874361 RepID=UPI000C35CBCC|nr:type II secretion system protein GspC [Idiomarina sp.]MBT40963.1 type II secretion system protein GspC [Idiomarina sp.]